MGTDFSPLFLLSWPLETAPKCYCRSTSVTRDWHVAFKSARCKRPRHERAWCQQCQWSPAARPRREGRAARGGGGAELHRHGTARCTCAARCTPPCGTRRRRRRRAVRCHQLPDSWCQHCHWHLFCPQCVLDASTGFRRRRPGRTTTAAPAHGSSQACHEGLVALARAGHGGATTHLRRCAAENNLKDHSSNFQG